jgi:hypothetical protein
MSESVFVLRYQDRSASSKLGNTDLCQCDLTVIPNTYNTVFLFIKVRKCDLAVANDTKFSQDYGIMGLTCII